MAVIYLKHDIHGTKVACSRAEADYDKTKGWKEVSEKEVLPKQEVLTEKEPSISVKEETPNWLTKPQPVIEQPIIQRRKRPGLNSN